MPPTVSVFPSKLVELFGLEMEIPKTSREVRTFGPSVTLLGPVVLPIHLCGLHIAHPFYFIDADAPPI